MAVNTGERPTRGSGTTQRKWGGSPLNRAVSFNPSFNAGDLGASSGDESWCGPGSSRGAWGEEQYGSPWVGGGRAGDAAPSPSSTQGWRASSTEATLDPQSPLEGNAAASLGLSPFAGSYGPSSREGAGGRRHSSWSERGTPTPRASGVYRGATRSSRFGERGTKLEWSDGEPDAVDGQAAVGVRSGGSGSTTAVTGTSRNKSTPRSGVRRGCGTPPAAVTITKITPATGSTDGVRRPWARHRESGAGRNIFGWRREFEAGGRLRDPVEGGHEEGKAEQHAQLPPTPDSAAAAAAEAGALAAGTVTPTNIQRSVGLAPKEQTLERRRRGVAVRDAAAIGKRTQHVQPGGRQQQSIGSALLSGDVPAPSSLRPPSASASAGAGGVPSVLLSGDEDPAGCWSSGPEGPRQSRERQLAADKAEDAAGGLRLVTPGEIRAAAEGPGKKERKDDEEETEEEEEVKREAELLSDDTEGCHLRVALARIQYLENGWMDRVKTFEKLLQFKDLRIQSLMSVHQNTPSLSANRHQHNHRETAATRKKNPGGGTPTASAVGASSVATSTKDHARGGGAAGRRSPLHGVAGNGGGGGVGGDGGGVKRLPRKGGSGGGRRSAMARQFAMTPPPPPPSPMKLKDRPFTLDTDTEPDDY